MKKTLIKSFVSALCALMAACAFITVNVYFPEKDVKKAYKSLDEMLLKQDKGGTETPAPEQPQAPESKPTSMSEHGGIRIALVEEAFAQEDISNELTSEVARMPEVQSAYREMKSRLPQLNALRDSGAVGEGSGGNVAVLDKGKLGGNQGVVDAENANRKTVINAMAKAILKITKQPENSQTLKQAREKAATTFAATKHDEAKPGWFIQTGGRWVQK